MSNKLYDILKRVQRFLPGFSVALTAYLAVFPVDDHVIQIVIGTIDFVAVILGIALEISTYQYNKLDMIASQPQAWDDSYLEEGDNHGEDR